MAATALTQGQQPQPDVLSKFGVKQNGVHSESDSYSTQVIKTVTSEQYIDKVWRIASKVLTRQDPPDLYPHYTYPGLSYYAWNDSTFWTSGFFPGMVWLLYERSLRPSAVSIPSKNLLEAARKWQIEMAKEQFKTDNHDLGFMIMPSFARDFDLTGNKKSLEIVIQTARSLASRFNPTTGVIRSWPGARTKEYDLNDTERDFVVVIDSMMNLELLYYAAKHSNDTSLADIATQHATTTLANHVRQNWSTYHVVNYDAKQKGVIRNRLTNQGYDHESSWARGQAWALYGYASVYQYTRDPKFLDAAINLAEYFLSRVDTSNGVDSIVYWDFDAPRPGVWDVSAATCAASGMLLLQELAPERCNYVSRVLPILDTVCRRATGHGDALLDRSTANAHVHSLHQLAEHGVVYADYYFLEAGNRLLNMKQ
ncbi:unnamed protein product [Clonostachys rosea]|uniref:Glucuronyl hydrolase n=1 Tax=Bionectria ochroleuca TaxID=29856 RepID=A0ABY6UZ09_BIOOC|nr:unnamed protein product [Clonostachys rosea]